MNTDDVVRIDVQTIADYYAASAGFMDCADPRDVPCVKSPFENCILHFGMTSPTRVRVESDTTRTVLTVAVGRSNLPGHIADVIAQVEHDDMGVPTEHYKVAWMDAPIPPTKEECEWIEKYFQVALMAISFMHIKGAVIEPPDAPSLVSSRRQARRFDQRIHTLRVEPLERVMREVRAASGLGVPVHLVRGHFKDFRNGAGVGGNPKAKGIYWTPAHIKGSPKRGISAKNYETGEPA